jgi:hypothetical protein
MREATAKSTFTGLIPVAMVFVLFSVIGIEEFVRRNSFAKIEPSAFVLPPSTQGPNRGRGRLPSDPLRAAYFGRCSVALTSLAGTLPDQRATLRLGQANMSRIDLLKASGVIGTLSQMLEANERRPAFSENSATKAFEREFSGQDKRLVDFSTNCMQASYLYANKYARVQAERTTKQK